MTGLPSRVLPLLSRTATATSQIIHATVTRGIILLTNITILGSASLEISLVSYDAEGNGAFPLETLNSPGTVGKFVTELYPGITTSAGPANTHFAHIVSGKFAVVVTPPDATPNTYSVDIILVP